MNNRIGAVILVLLCVGLGIALLAVHKNAKDEIKKDTDNILALSNRLVDTRQQLEDYKQVAATLEKDLENTNKAHAQAYGELTNNFSQVSADLSKTAAALTASNEELSRRATKIAELESTNQALDKQALDLSASITNLTLQIADTQKKLATSEGDKAFLEKELKRLTADKQELERQFADLTVLRAQVAKLKDELSVARRIEWIRQGLFASSDQRGAQKLMHPLAAAQTKPPPKPEFDLNVEVTADGKVRVIPPTNAPAATNVPAQ
jgi:chromosome segregation ATPase